MCFHRRKFRIVFPKGGGQWPRGWSQVLPRRRRAGGTQHIAPLVRDSPDDSSHALGGRCGARACAGVMSSKSDVLKAKLSKLSAGNINAACEALLEAKLPNKGARM